MFDRIKKIATSAALRALTANSVPMAYRSDFNDIVYKDANGVVRVIASANGQAIVSATAATLAVTSVLHAGRTVVLNRAGGITVTLPAATGSGDRYTFVVGTALSAASHVIAVVDNTDFMRGLMLEGADDSSGAAKAWSTANTGTLATESDTITMDGSTKSGFVGTFVTLQDIATDTWRVEILGSATGTEATPFSAAV